MIPYANLGTKGAQIVQPCDKPPRVISGSFGATRRFETETKILRLGCE